ncbi:MAG: UPF0147 family protein [Candidatus Diapherotrites archaeon]
MDNELSDVADLMEEVIEDTTVPRNIRRSVDDAKQKIMSKEEIGLRITSAIYCLDDISNDINMPSHTRTEIWTIISELERLREKSK